MDATFRFLQRHPPRSGWILFCLACASVLVLPLALSSSSVPLSAGPALLGVVTGLVFGLLAGPRMRWLLLLPALLVPLMLLELVPPWRIIAADVRTLLSWSESRPPLVLPSAIEAAVASTGATLRATWDGDRAALNWTIAHVVAVLGYIAAAILGLGLRRRAAPLAWSLPLLTVIVATGVLVRSDTGAVISGVFLVLLVSLWGGFLHREQSWKQHSIDFADDLRRDVAIAGVGVLITIITLGFSTPSFVYDRVTDWVWSGIQLPEGLLQLDRTLAGRGGGRARQGVPQPGEDLLLGRSLEQAEPDEVALTVRVEELPDGVPLYWRGRIFEQYTGRNWTTGPVRKVAQPALAVDALPPRMIVQHVSDPRPERRLRYGLPDIIALDQPATAEQSVYGSYVGWVGRAEVESYTVFSSPPDPRIFDPTKAVELQRYLAPFLDVPESLPQRVVELARQITQDAASQTERALAIETYLRDLNYSYEVAPLPAGGDAVDQFIFTMRSGYCTYYASAMAMMARAVGIPSRVAVGYATGEYDAERDVFVVHEADAHAWAELYIDGRGWTVWEATPIRPVPARATQPGQPQVPLTGPLTPAESELPLWRTVTSWLIVLGVVVLVLLIVLPWRRWMTTASDPAWVHADLYRYGRRAGVQPAAGDSIEDYVGRLAGTIPAAQRPLRRVAALLTAYLYRSAPLDEAEERTCVSSWYTARDILGRAAGKRR